MMAISRLAALALPLAVLGVGSSAALAGACTNTGRKLSFAQRQVSLTAKADMTVKNATLASSFDVVISRGSGTPTEKRSGTLKPGDKISKLSDVNNVGDFKISIVPTGTRTGTTCYYRVDFYSGDKTQWWIPTKTGVTCNGGDVSVACEKSYNADKIRWNTTYTITD